MHTNKLEFCLKFYFWKHLRHTALLLIPCPRKPSFRGILARRPWSCHYNHQIDIPIFRSEPHHNHKSSCRRLKRLSTMRPINSDIPGGVFKRKEVSWWSLKTNIKFSLPFTLSLSLSLSHTYIFIQTHSMNYETISGRTHTILNFFVSSCINR